MNLVAEIKTLLTELGFEEKEYADNLAYVLQCIFNKDMHLERTAFELLDQKIRAQNVIDGVLHSI